MKKYTFFLLFLGFVLLSPLKLFSNTDTVSIKLSLGLSRGGYIDDKWAPSTDYFIQGTDVDVKKYNSVQKSIEIFFPVFRNFSLSVGVGHFSKLMRATKGIFTLPSSSELSGDFFSSPEIHFESIPILITAKWTYTVWPEAFVYVFGGFGYYFSKFNIYKHDMTYNLQQPYATLNYFPLDYHGRTESLGYHGGTGFEIYAGSSIFFFIETVYRRVVFNTIERTSDGEKGEGLIFLYFSNLGGEEIWGDIAYRINSIVLSEIILQAGVRINF